jgi:hypothetical protein
MTRNFVRFTATWPSGSPTSSPFSVEMGYFAGGVLHISGDFTDAQIGLQQDVFGMQFPLVDNQLGWTGVSLASATGNASIIAPEWWFYANGGVRLWSHSAGSGVPQAAERFIVVDLKS